MTDALYKPDITSLEAINHGKVRDIYAVDDQHILIVTSDRISAFDVVLPDPIPHKGEVLNTVSRFWFDMMTPVVANHMCNIKPEDVLAETELQQLGQRAVVVRRMQPLPVEAIARGYVIGSGWKDYQTSGAISGIQLPSGLQQAEQLPEPVFTPSTKADIGDHDENIDFNKTVQLIGRQRAEQMRELSLEIYTRAAGYARDRGIIIADTKFEFGLDEDGNMVLIDEVLTPDSSRFWPMDEYRTGISPPSFDKQYVRDYLETLDWDKTPPGPRLPDEVILNTSNKYKEARQRLTRDT
ncbi:MAG: phosphoribosylaminoimidazolesuccinocarboxamide synthase [Thiotrichales bacterium]|nr:phosphoribosylaminoimidazolesuccinocarboxamide synthase [Thiotrichales bacterium]